KKSTESTALNLLAIASMGRWHGYDRLIGGLHDYYSGGGRDAIVLHLVGDGPEIPRYRQLVRQYQLEDTVIFHGFKSGAELDELFDICGVAIECLAAHRKGLHLSSSLKSREYGAKGMPVVTSCEIDAFPSDICNYIMKVPEDDSNIDINQIIKFYHSLINEYGDEEKLAKQIRNDAKARCDISVVMKPIINYFQL
ncbi:MAG: glycosyltransferase, partial [Eubacterium sp.]